MSETVFIQHGGQIDAESYHDAFNTIRIVLNRVYSGEPIERELIEKALDAHMLLYTPPGTIL